MSLLYYGRANGILSSRSITVSQATVAAHLARMKSASVASAKIHPQLDTYCVWMKVEGLKLMRDKGARTLSL